MTLYQQIRAAGKSMHGKSLQATRDLDFDPLRIAKQMTLPTSGRTLIFDDEAMQNAFFDFWFHEYRVNGKSLVESVDPAAAELDPLETEVLEAHCHAHTSLFLADAVLLGSNQVRLRDLLNPDQPEVLLTDFAMSDSIYRAGTQVAMYSRVVVVRGIAMTSGFNFTFNPARVPGILDACRKRLKKVPAAELSAARFVFFFQKHRQFGEERVSKDVV